jgi:hypothetical protein
MTMNSLKLFVASPRFATKDVEVESSKSRISPATPMDGDP